MPIATGERLNNLQEFAMLIKRNAVSYVRLDVCMCGAPHYQREENSCAGRSA
ncbi:MAG: enolase C-terminal domain-like protein [Symbiopectobacterium sp.]